MRIVLKTKVQSHDKDPLIVMFEEEEAGKMVKKIHSVTIGGHLDLADQTAYEVMAKYKGLFVVAPEVGTATPGSQKSLKGYENKSAVL